jgi:hypothetical protein
MTYLERVVMVLEKEWVEEMGLFIATCTQCKQGSDVWSIFLACSWNGELAHGVMGGNGCRLAVVPTFHVGFSRERWWA